MFVIVLKEFVIYSGFRFLLVSISDSNCKHFVKQFTKNVELYQNMLYNNIDHDRFLFPSERGTVSLAKSNNMM